jgi:hypothetical protein
VFLGRRNRLSVLRGEGKYRISTDKGKKAKWGPVIPERRSTRIRNDGRTSLEKAKDNKKNEDVEDVYMKGKTSKPKKSLLYKN